MNRSGSVALMAIVVGLAALSPALVYGLDLRDDQIPYGPNGTIGRGTDSSDGWAAGRSGIRLFGSGSPNSSFSGSFFSNDGPAPRNTYVPATYSVSATSRPYQTQRYYLPGDGYRYPLYYDPATRTYFYYPTRR